MLAGGLEPSRRATLYLTAVVATGVASLLTSLLVAVLMSARSRAAVVIGSGIAAVLVPSWVGALLVQPGSTVVDGPMPLLLALPWVAPVLVGAAIGWAGLGSPGRVVAALVALAALWIGPAAVTAISSATGSRVLAGDPTEMAAYAGEVFVAALGQPVLVGRALVTAVAVAGAVLAIRGVTRRRRMDPEPT